MAKTIVKTAYIPTPIARALGCDRLRLWQEDFRQLLDQVHSANQYDQAAYEAARNTALELITDKQKYPTREVWFRMTQPQFMALDTLRARLVKDFGSKPSLSLALLITWFMLVHKQSECTVQMRHQAVINSSTDSQADDGALAVSLLAATSSD